MAVSQEFLEYVLDQLLPLRVTSRKMFGGVGLYQDGKIFGLIANEIVYLRVDDSNRQAYLDNGCLQFKPFPDKPMLMPYYELPASVLDDSEELCNWALQSLRIPSNAKRRSRK